MKHFVSLLFFTVFDWSSFQSFSLNSFLFFLLFLSIFFSQLCFVFLATKKEWIEKKKKPGENCDSFFEEQSNKRTGKGMREGRSEKNIKRWVSITSYTRRNSCCLSVVVYFENVFSLYKMLFFIFFLCCILKQTNRVKNKMNENVLKHLQMWVTRDSNTDRAREYDEERWGYEEKHRNVLK